MHLPHIITPFPETRSPPVHAPPPEVSGDASSSSLVVADSVRALPSRRRHFDPQSAASCHNSLRSELGSIGEFRGSHVVPDDGVDVVCVWVYYLRVAMTRLRSLGKCESAGIRAGRSQ